MKDKNLSSVQDGAFLLTADETQARLLASPRDDRFFHPFWGRSNTVAGAAAELGESLGAVHYRVGKFLDAGLLEVTRTEPRHGRAIRHYRSVADAFFIPAGLDSHPSAAERLLGNLLPVIRSIASGLHPLPGAGGTPGRWLRLDEARRIHSSSCGLDSGGNLRLQRDAAGAVQYGSLRLTPAEAEQFRHELARLVARLHERGSPADRKVTRLYSFVTGIARTGS